MRVVTLICTAIILAGCGKGGTDYCDQHKLYHADHAGTVGELNLVYTDDGQINAKLVIPYQSLGNGNLASGDADVIRDAVRTLEDVDRVFSIEGKNTCRNRRTSVSRDSGKLVAHYIFNCGADNRLENVDIRLLEHLPELDELVADIDTPAAGKTFAISQQCGKPLYNY